MLPALDVLRRALAQVLVDKEEQGHDTSGLDEELATLPDSYDALVDFAERLAQLPLRDGWPYVEPDDLETIRQESDPGRATGPMGPLAGDASPRAETAFLSAVCGCILGKPLEFDPTLEELRAVLHAGRLLDRQRFRGTRRRQRKHGPDHGPGILDGSGLIRWDVC